ncbi:mannose-1-phosphate guanylyltransferase [Luedemannella flava]|uniref:Mannose-1-phosphate guanylyltransferase n=1 Tax=Luedemannella flava TaxID=349316 RepID=A0ABP4XW91_9ACTN
MPVTPLLYVVIPAGGSGTRLWPLSRAGRPKFLHALTGEPATLLQATVHRLDRLTVPEQTLVVTGVAHATAVGRQLPDLPEENVLVEPSPRDSCAAIGLAAAVISRREPDAIMGSFAADHLVRDRESFERTISEAVAGAREGKLMTIGITPTHPETGYGYLRCGAEVGPGPVRVVEEFAEKPSPDVAVEYVSSGRYLWNAGMFVWRVDVFLAELRRQQPALFDGLTEIAAAWGGPHQDAVLGEVWPQLTRISVDYAVMEGAAAAGLVATVPGTFGWNDVGDFDTLGEVLEPYDEVGNVVVNAAKTDSGEPPVLFHDAGGLIVVPESGRLIAALGVENLIIVDTEDAVLVCHRDRAQDVKALVDALKEQGDHQYV